MYFIWIMILKISSLSVYEREEHNLINLCFPSIFQWLGTWTFGEWAALRGGFRWQTEQRGMICLWDSLFFFFFYVFYLSWWYYFQNFLAYCWGIFLDSMNNVETFPKFGTKYCIVCISMVCMQGQGIRCKSISWSY